MAITDNQIDNAIPEHGDATPHPTQPNQALMNQLLKMVRDEVAAALTADNLQQNVGISQTTAMSQKAVTDELQTKLTAGDLVQATGQSTTDVMSQQAVSEQLIGVGNLWSDTTITSGATYTNTSGRTKIVSIRLRSSTASYLNATGYVDGFIVSQQSLPAAPSGQDNVYGCSIIMIVPPGSTYSATYSGEFSLLAREL